MSGYHMGINLGHDRSVAVVQDGEIRVAIEQEPLPAVTRRSEPRAAAAL